MVRAVRRPAKGAGLLLPVAAAALLAAAAAAGGAALSSCASAPQPALAEQWYELGNSWLDKGDWKRAGEAYSHALELNPSFAAASFNMARALAEAGDYDAALRSLDKLLAADPKNVRILSARAYVLFKKGDAAEALRAYGAVIALDPYSPDAVYNSALLRFAAGQGEQAVQDLGRLLAYKPDDSQSLLLLGRIEESLGKPEAVIDAYEKARVLGKADGAALERLGLLYEGQRRFADAMSTLDAATKADASRAGAWFALARLRLVVAEDGDGGLDALTHALGAGFSDKDAAAKLMAEPVVADREKVADLLRSKGLLP